jgi:hypothetical protein
MWSWQYYTWLTLTSSYHWLDFSCWPADMVVQYAFAVFDVFSVSVITKVMFKMLSFLQVLCNCLVLRCNMAWFELNQDLCCCLTFVSCILCLHMFKMLSFLQAVCNCLVLACCTVTWFKLSQVLCCCHACISCILWLHMTSPARSNLTLQYTSLWYVTFYIGFLGLYDCASW